MSTECNKALAEAEKKLEYYKEMYEMRTEAFITLMHEHEWLREKFDMYLKQETLLGIAERAMEK